MLKLEANAFARFSCGNRASVDEGSPVIAEVAAAPPNRHHCACGAPRPDGCREETISFL